MFCSKNDVPRADNTVPATVCWMSERSSLRAGAMLRIKHTTHTARAMINSLDFKIDINQVSVTESSSELNLNEIGQITLRTSEPLMFDDYSVNRRTGSFILIDESSNETVAAGMIGHPGFIDAS